MSLSSNQLRLNNTAPSFTFCTTQHTFPLCICISSSRPRCEVYSVPQHSILSKGSRHVCTRAHVHTHALQHSIFEVKSVTSIAHNFNNQIYFMVCKGVMEATLTAASSAFHECIHLFVWKVHCYGFCHISVYYTSFSHTHTHCCPRGLIIQRVFVSYISTIAQHLSYPKIFIGTLNSCLERYIDLELS